MAQIQPAYFDPATPFSERKVYEVLRDGLPADWLVLHSRRVVAPATEGHRSAYEGEVDFLVFNPDWGMIGLEVKGGRIARGPNGWVSVDRSGDTHSIKDPGQQAQRAVHSLAKYLRDHPKSRQVAGQLHFGWAVVFPDVNATGDLGPDLPRALVIDQADLRSPKASIVRACHSFSKSGSTMAGEQRAVLLSALTPQLQLVSSLSSRIDEEAPVLLRLTQEQIQILDTLAEMPRLAVKGPAGSGKTIVATEKAKRLADEGQRVLFLCYNRPLAEFLAQTAEGYKVKTFHTFCRDLSVAAGLKFVPPKEEKASKEFWETRAPELLIEALSSYPDERYDAVVVDEGQDFREYWWLAVEKLLKDQRKGHLWVFFDPQQDLYGGGPTEALGLQVASLTWNCRNTERIATHAFAKVGSTPKLKPGTPEGVPVRELMVDTDQAMVDAVRKTLHQLVSDEKIETNRIVVLSPKGAPASPVWRARKLGNLTLVEFPHRPGPQEVAFGSLQRFKGLEADVVILCDVRESDAMCGPAHLYVGTSRAKHVLVVVKSRSR